jgi:hypothetical protein
LTADENSYAIAMPNPAIANQVMANMDVFEYRALPLFSRDTEDCPFSSPALHAIAFLLCSALDQSS